MSDMQAAAKELRRMLTATTTAARIAATTAVLADTLSDTDLAAVTPLYPTWTPTGRYTRDTLAVYKDQLYRCLQDHTAQQDWTPVAAVSLWVPIRQASSGPAEWEQRPAENPYRRGDEVTFNGRVYRSLIDANTWSPEAYPAGWQQV